MKIIERVVEATHEPNKNDLWLKPGEGGSATLNRYAGGQWRPIGGGNAGSDGSDGSGSGCDCDTSDFIRLSDFDPVINVSTEDRAFTMQVDKPDIKSISIWFIDDPHRAARIALTERELVKRMTVIIDGEEPSQLDPQISHDEDDNPRLFSYESNLITLYRSPLDLNDDIGIDVFPGLEVPEGFDGWVLLVQEPKGGPGEDTGEAPKMS